MLLVEITINSVVNRVSIEGHGLTHNWKPMVAGFDAPTLAIPTDHGGYAKMAFGSISFNPELFSGDWPPPVSCPISIYYTDTTEDEKELVFDGTAHLSEFDRESIRYALNGPIYDDKLSILGLGTLETGRAYKIVNYVAGDDFTNVGGANVTGTIFTATGTTPTTWTNYSTLAPHWNDTLDDVLTDILTQIPEITAVNTTYARATSPNVTWTLTSDRLAINVASDIAAFYSHLIYVIGSTAYLVDMLLDNGEWTLTEFEFFAYPKYRYKTPIAEIKCSSDNVIYSRASTYPYGMGMDVEAFHSVKANIDAALDDIMNIENAPRVNLSVPMIAGNFPKLGQKITLPDTGNVEDLESWIRVRILQYDFVDTTISIEGEGAISAA